MTLTTKNKSMKRQLLLLLTILMLGAKTFAQSQEDGIKQMTKENEPSDINGAKDCLPNRPNRLNMPKPPTTVKPTIKNKPTM